METDIEYQKHWYGHFALHSQKVINEVTLTFCGEHMNGWKHGTSLVQEYSADQTEFSYKQCLGYVSPSRVSP